MLEHFSARARAVLVLAQQESRRLGHEAVAPEHLLAALIAEGRGVGARSLGELGVTIDAVRREASVAYGSSARFDRGGNGNARALRRPLGAQSLPYLATTKRLLEQAGREAAELSDEVIATEHLLLAFSSEERATGEGVLARLGQGPDGVRSAVLERRALRAGPGEMVEAPPPPTRPALPTQAPLAEVLPTEVLPTEVLPAAVSPAAVSPAKAPLPKGLAAKGLAAKGPAGARAARAARAPEVAERRRWSLAPRATAENGPPPGLSPGRPASPLCPGCGGLLQGRLTSTVLEVEDAAAPDAVTERTASGRAGSRLRLVHCSSCGHVLHAGPAGDGPASDGPAGAFPDGAGRAIAHPRGDDPEGSAPPLD